MYNFVLHAAGCSSNCVFCGARPAGLIEENISREFNKLQRIIADGASIGSIEISGNDPCEYVGLPDLVTQIKAATGAKDIVLSSHGRTLTTISEIESLAVAGITQFVFPVYGATPSVHDAVTRRPGSFSETMASIRSVRQLKIPLRVTTMMVRENQHALEELFQFVGVFSNVFSVAIPHYNRAAFESSAPDFAVLFEQLSGAVLSARRSGYRPLLRNIPPCFLNFNYDYFEESNAPLFGYEHFRSSDALARGRIVIRDGQVIPRYRLTGYRSECSTCIVRGSCPGIGLDYLSRADLQVRPVLGGG